MLDLKRLCGLVSTEYPTIFYTLFIRQRLGRTYQFNKDTDTSHERLLSAYELLDFVERGRTWGVIKDNVKLADRINECQEQNQRLRENQQELETEILRLKIENENCHKALDTFGARSNVTEDNKE